MTARGDVVGIVGAGTFGTALASVVARAGRPVVLWSRDQAVVDSITHQRRCPRLPEAALPEPLVATTSAAELAARARLIILAVVSSDVRVRARELGDVLDGGHLVVHAVGALAAPDDERVSEVMGTALSTLRIGALAGPALPADLVSGRFASMVVASRFDEVISETRRLLSAPPLLRVYGSHDLVGVELASALACAYTIALGLGDGMGLGPGARAVLITRALAEAGRLIAAAGGDGRTMAGLAGLGNLLVRSAEGATRPAATPGAAREPDRSADYALGRALATGSAPRGDLAATPGEGARAAIAGARLAQRLRVRVPLISAVAGLLEGSIDIAQAAALAGDAVADAE